MSVSVQEPSESDRSFFRKLKDLLKSELVSEGVIFLSTLATSYFAGKKPMYALFGLPLFAGWGITKSYLKQDNVHLYICKNYKPEISAITGIPEASITPDSIGRIMDQYHDNPKFELFRELRLITKTSSKTDAISTSFSAALATVVAMTTARFEKKWDMHGLISKASAGINSLVHYFSSDPDAYNWPTSVARVAQGVNDGHYTTLIHPSYVLLAFTRAQPAIAAEVREKFGKPYIQLSYKERLQAVDMFESKLGIRAIAQKINDGVIRPQELGWLAYGMRSGVPENQAKAADNSVTKNAARPQPQPAEKVHDITLNQRVVQATPALAEL